MRVSLPVDPNRKTQSEVATVNGSRVTDIPTPRIIAYDATRDNQLEFEWILMTEVHGKPLAHNLRELDISAKPNLTKRLAQLSVSLWRKQIKVIGNI